MAWRVVTFSTESLDSACKRLEQLVASTGYEPDCVLGIKTGGWEVAKLMWVGRRHEFVTVQRPSTKNKGALFTKLMRCLPYPVLDFLRKLEARILSLRKPSKVAAEEILLPDLSGVERLIIIDDAVDSGSTLKSVFDAVREALPHADVLSAVITLTRRDAIFKPDFALYNDQTLIRFPWSKDYK